MVTVSIPPGTVDARNRRHCMLIALGRQEKKMMVIFLRLSDEKVCRLVVTFDQVTG